MFLAWHYYTVRVVILELGMTCGMVWWCPVCMPASETAYFCTVPEGLHVLWVAVHLFANTR